jgi:hypothetical protein
MENNYVNRKPDKITGLIIFRTFDKYKKVIENNYKVKDVDPIDIGFFLKKQNIIVMQYVEGKGTILHEVTHNYLKYDFPNCPVWFNEGLASLHETSKLSGGKLKGGVSLRLLTLVKAIKINTYTNLRILMRSKKKDFYEETPLFHYAQARYFLYWLQETGMLERYYLLLRNTMDMDKTGITQLETIMKKPMKEIEKDFVIFICAMENV